MTISELLRNRVYKWRTDGYPSAYPALSEILDFNYIEDENRNRIPRFLRRAQVEALETYWYLRVVEKTPLMKDLYQKLASDPAELLKILEINLPSDEIVRLSIHGNLLDTIFKQIITDELFCKKYKLEAVRETLSLPYPSYILALAMGSGKTLLIGAIIATEFSLAFEYHNGFFVKNALVFAPGKTILGALKNISDIHFEEILPPRFYNHFISSIKITYTKDGQQELRVLRHSGYNIIITNTEKIRIQKPTGSTQTTLLSFKKREKIEERCEVANLRLQAIASLPQLAIFSDEGHHTYGRTLDADLKKVRKTVDYLVKNTNVVCVVNTTGTPYFKKQVLKDVVYWYGLSQGIQDGILKEVRDNVISFQQTNLENFVSWVIKDFYHDYRDVTIHNGAKAKIAIYFPNTHGVDEALPIVKKTLAEMGEDPSTMLAVHNKSTNETKDFFNNRINDTHNPYRVYLLVNMGTEGWNCLSLFATALARKLSGSNNFVLQAASRCLRQTLGNSTKAKIYLSTENVPILNTQLQETYGETLQTLNTAKQDMIKYRIVIRKTHIPPIRLTKTIRKIVKRKNKQVSLNFTVPEVESSKAILIKYKIREPSQTQKPLHQKEMRAITVDQERRDIFVIAVELSSVFRIDALDIYWSLLAVYPEGKIPVAHINELKKQIEKQTARWQVEEATKEESLSIIHPEGFRIEETGAGIRYVGETSYKKSRSEYILKYETMQSKNIHGFSFHYSPYNFDSLPEKDFLLNMLEIVNEKPNDIDDIYFTGGLHTPRQTDIIFEYRNSFGQWKNYVPDFLIRKKDGRSLIVEIKKERLRNDEIEGESGFKATSLHKIEQQNEPKLKYQMLFTDTADIGFENINMVKEWVY